MPVSLGRPNKLRVPTLRVADIAALMVGLPMCAGLSAPALAADMQIADIRDTLDTAVQGPNYINGIPDPFFDVYVADHEQFDTNVFRLANGVDVKQFVGPNASREDHINSPTAGLDGQWVLGKQIVDLQLRADENRFSQNTDLNNFSTNDKVAWNWGLGSVFSGQVGADYTRALTSFVNALIYNRNVYSRSEYFAAARYQVGPRWALYGGVLDSNLKVEDVATQFNNYHQKTVDMGAELAVSDKDTFGLDYRYTDARYPNAISLAGSTFDPDYRDTRVRLLAKRVLTEKTTLDLSAGYLRREYANSAIGSFSGPIWRVAMGWQPTEKTQLVVSTWRELQSYLTDQTNYYRGTGASIAPTWIASEKISLSLTVSREDQTFIGSSFGAQNQLARRDTVNSQVLTFTYTPIRALIFDVSYNHAQRDSNQPLRPFTDSLAAAGVKFMFL
jgi:exopolysaccharide biosynthesis operon protein EpsL